jgi:hypothetical protein
MSSGVVVDMGLLNKEQILSSNDRNFIDIDVPEWGGTVRISVLTGSDREKIEAEFANIGKDKYIVRAMCVALSVVDENGNAIFSKEDLQALNQKSWKALDKIVNRIKELNGIGDEQVEAIAKN